MTSQFGMVLSPALHPFEPVTPRSPSHASAREASLVAREFVFLSRGRISERPDTNRHWFLSVCHRQAGAGRADFNEHLHV